MNSIKWRGNTLVLEGPSMCLSGNNTIITMNWNTLFCSCIGFVGGILICRRFVNVGGFFGGIFGGILGGLLSSSISRTVTKSIYSNITVNGGNSANYIQDESVKKIDIKWSESGRSSPILSGLNLSGGGSFDIRILLNHQCTIDSSGVTSIKVFGNNSDSDLTASLSGSGNLTGNGTLRSCNLNVSGAGSATGFHVHKSLKAKVSGVGTVNLTHDSNCSVSQNVSVIGTINIRPR